MFFKLLYVSVIMLLFKLPKPAALFRFKLLYASSNSLKFRSSNSLKFSSSNSIFLLWDIKKYWNCFTGLGIFFSNFDLPEVINLFNPLAMFCGFCIMVLSTLCSWGRRSDFVFYFPVIPFNLQVPLESVLYLCNIFE